MLKKIEEILVRSLTEEQKALNESIGMLRDRGHITAAELLTKDIRKSLSPIQIELTELIETERIETKVQRKQDEENKKYTEEPKECQCLNCRRGRQFIQEQREKGIPVGAVQVKKDGGVTKEHIQSALPILSRLSVRNKRIVFEYTKKDDVTRDVTRDVTIITSQNAIPVLKLSTEQRLVIQLADAEDDGRIKNFYIDRIGDIESFDMVA